MFKGIKIGDFLLALTKEERVGFAEFVSSAYFNKSKYVLEETALVGHLLQVLESPDTSGDFDRLAAYDLIFPGSPYIEKKLEKLLSNIHSLLKHYVAVMSIEKKKFDTDFRLLKFFRERNLNSRYEKLKTQMIEEHITNAKINVRTLEEHFHLMYEVSRFEHIFHHREAYKTIPAILEIFESYYAQVKLELLNQYLLDQNLVKFDIPQSIQDIINDVHFNTFTIDQNISINIAHQIFLIQKSKKHDPKLFEGLLSFIKQNEQCIEEKYLHFILAHLRNICAIMVINNHSDYLPILFQLQKEHYERGLLFLDGKITPSALLTVSNTALLCGYMEWGANFLTENKDNIMGESPDGEFHKLCMANLSFYQGNYEAALDMLPNIVSNIEYQLFAKRLEIKCFYEMKSELTFYKAEAFKVFLSRMSKTLISELVRERNTAFNNMVLQLIKYALASKDQIKKLPTRFKAKGLIADREWVIQKINALL